MNCEFIKFQISTAKLFIFEYKMYIYQISITSLFYQISNIDCEFINYQISISNFKCRLHIHQFLNIDCTFINFQESTANQLSNIDFESIKIRISVPRLFNQKLLFNFIIDYELAKYWNSTTNLSIFEYRQKTINFLFGLWILFENRLNFSVFESQL